MKILTLILSILLFSSSAFAQKRGKRPTAAPVVTITPQEAMESYDFQLAEELLEQEIANLEKKKLSTEHEEEMLELARARRIKLQATEQIVIIDSIVTSKQQMLDCIKLSDESGSLSYIASSQDSLQRMQFVNQLGNKQILADQDRNAHLKLYEQIMEGGTWSDKNLCKGLSEEATDDLNFPFMLNDGITLYYASRCDESIGGYDIFMTRYDTDDKVFLAPENIGMPFNSPANDYLLVIDEFYNIGYFVSDRHQPADSVCIYVFIPNETRKVYHEEEIGEMRLRNLARINSIRDTWTNKEVVAQAKQRYEKMRKGDEAKDRKHDFDFVINDARTYTTLTDFKNKTAAKKVSYWLENTQDIAKTSKDLESLRLQYRNGGNDKKMQIAPQIRLLEAKLEKIEIENHALEKEIRKLELEQ